MRYKTFIKNIFGKTAAENTFRTLLFVLFVTQIHSLGYCQFWDRDKKEKDRPLVAPNVIRDVRFDQLLNAQIPLDTEFVDEHGQAVKLSSYFVDKPIILVMAYYECPMLCTQVLNGLAQSVRTLEYTPGKEYTILTVSINPHETPELAAKKQMVYVNNVKRPGVEKGWHFLTGKEENIKKLANSIGFRYVYDPKLNLYYHAAGITVLTSKGIVSHYFYGTDFWPNDLKPAIILASDGKVGTPVEHAILYCYQYDPASGKYSLSVLRIMQIFSFITMSCVGAFMFISFRGERVKRLDSVKIQNKPKLGTEEK